MSSLQLEFPTLSLRQLCSLLGVSRSWLYEHPHRQLLQHQRDVALRDEIEHIVLDYPGYGYRRVTAELRRRAWHVNHTRVLRLLRQEGLLCERTRRWIPTTDSNHRLHVYENVLKRRDVSGPDQVWIADSTYIRLPTTCVYLACVLDAWSRRCSGWKVSRTIDTHLTLAALNQAIETRQSSAGLIHHAASGVQYAARAYVERLGAIDARVRMSATGNPYDNAKAERFFNTRKREEVQLTAYETFADAEANRARFIDAV